MAKNNNVKELTARVNAMEIRLKELEEKNVKLERSVEQLESRVAVSENVSAKLVIELDRLDQYHRRPNILIRNAFLPENESHKKVCETVHKIIGEDLSLPDAVDDIDKLHRVGKVKTREGKKSQDIIVRFKTHKSRYDVYQDKKKARNVKIAPNLTKRRGKLLYDVWESRQRNYA